jgi:anti-sigma B factor antagonist
LTQTRNLSETPGPSAEGGPEFGVTIDPAGVVWLSGEVDMARSEALGRGLDVAIDGQGPLVVDLSGVTFMDSSGLRVLLVTSAFLGKRGLVLRRPRRNVTRLLQIVDIDSRDNIRLELDNPDPDPSLR